MEEQTSHSSQKEATEHSKKSSLTSLVIGILIALILGVGLYYGAVLKSVKSMSRSDFVLSSAGFFHMPVAKVNGQKILYTEYVDNLKAMELFYETDDSGIPKPSEEEKSDYVLSRLMINELIVQQAKKLNVASIPQEDLDNIVETQVVTNFADRAEADSEILRRYGWTMDQFVAKIIYPAELEKKVAESYASTLPSNDEDIKSTAQAVLDRIKAGEDFATLAEEFGSDATASQGGDLGWFGRGVMVQPFEEAVFVLEPGELAQELVETQFGYHIIRVDEKRTKKDEKTGEDVEEVKARHILFMNNTSNGDDFREYMNQELLNAKIYVLETVHNPFEQFLQDQGLETVDNGDDTNMEEINLEDMNVDVTSDTTTMEEVAN